MIKGDSENIGSNIVKFNSNELLKLSLPKNQLWYDIREMMGDVDLKQ